MSCFLIDYHFADRLLPGALKVLERLSRLGTTVILSTETSLSRGAVASS
jgi:hypothetical protein